MKEQNFNSHLVEIVEGSARARKEQPIPRVFIQGALNRIHYQMESVRTYPTGAPRLIDVYALAKQLYVESQKDSGFNYRTERCPAIDELGRRCVWGQEHAKPNGPPHDFEATPIKVVIDPPKLH